MMILSSKGSTLFPGIQERLSKELAALAPSTIVTSYLFYLLLTRELTINLLENKSDSSSREEVQFLDRRLYYWFLEFIRPAGDHKGGI